MQNLMMDLLDFAQIEKNTFKLNKEFLRLLSGARTNRPKLYKFFSALTSSPIEKIGIDVT